MDILNAKQAKVVFAGLAPVANGVRIHLEYPRVGSKLGVPEEGVMWLSSDRMLLPGANIAHVSRDAALVGPFHWEGRCAGIIEAVVRKCIADAETQQTYMEVDLVAEREVGQDGTVTTRVPSW